MGKTYSIEEAQERIHALMQAGRADKDQWKTEAVTPGDPTSRVKILKRSHRDHTVWTEEG
jgi:hypothetical protein